MISHEIPSTQVMEIEALLLEILSYVDVSSLGRAEQVSSKFREAALHGAWKDPAARVRGDLSVLQSDSRSNYKEQVRRYCQSQQYTRRLATEHRRCYCTSSIFNTEQEGPRQPLSSTFPNLKTGALLSNHVDSYAFHVRIAVLENSFWPSRFSATAGAEVVSIFDEFAPVELLASPVSNGREYSTIQLSLGVSTAWAFKRLVPGDLEDHVLMRLEVTVTAVHKTTGSPSLLLATGGGTRSREEPGKWLLCRRRADSHPNPAALGFGVIPYVQATVSSPGNDACASLTIRVAG